MANERIYEALCRLFPDADPETAWKLEQGAHTNWEIAVTEWNLPCQQPTQSQLDAAYLQLAKADRCAAILRELDAIDMQSVRPVRAKLAGTATPEDEAKIASLEERASKLRHELSTL